MVAVSGGLASEEMADQPAIRVFGGIGVEGTDGPISIGGARQRRLLALLVARSGSVVTIDWLAEHLWADDHRPERTIPALRTYLSRLRASLPEAARDWIETESAGYRFSPPADAVEHLRFGSLRAQATRARGLKDPLSALNFLDEALALWRGDPFRELEDFDWARAEIEQLRLDRLEMLEERWEAALALGRHTQITGELAAFTAEHGLRDRAVRQHALALHRSGRTTEALRVIDAHRRTLAERSGLDPSPVVIELEAALLAGDTALDVDKVGRPLRGYRLLEEVGSGAFSVVWRGIQPSVDREVAVKQIRSELASQPEFIRRFEAEAHLVARIEHPHVVPLIDFWRDPDSAYLVMRWLGGGTLEGRLDDGPLTVEETMKLARQIGGALSAAHRNGVVHRDVKAANILFDDDENAYLTDFGIALEAAKSSGPEAALSSGSPAYASPEQIRQERLGSQADIFSLGVVLFECVAGSLPFPSSSSVEELVELQLHTPYPALSDLGADITASISDAVAKATAKDPEDRFASVDEFLDALESKPIIDPADSVSAKALPALLLNPYKGLRAFGPGDSDVFFGRERLVRELVGFLAGGSTGSRCLVVVGPSGSGKSSVVRAGLVPALRAGAVEGSADWFTTTMVPGTDPYESLEAALLRIAVNPAPSLLDQLRDGKRGILRSLRRCLGSDGDRVVVTIDQFEEVFTGGSSDDARDFLDALAVAVNDPTSPLRLIVTIRADYYDRPLEHPAFAQIVKAGAVEVTPLAGDELERAIVEPARRVGVEFEPGLVARIAAETVGQPSPLPLLQYTLSELFDRRAAGVLTMECYDEIGGLSGALASSAEALFLEADDPQRASIRRIFGSMTHPGEEAADLRRRVPLSDIGDDPSDSWVLERFGAARLLSFDRDVATREPTVEVAHEALLREWPRLVTWLEEDFDLLRSAAAVAGAASSWDEGGREKTDLYRGGRLENALGLALAAPDRLRPLDGDFIDESRVAAESTRRIEERRIRRLRRLVAGVGVALVVALIAGAVAFRQQRRADDEAVAARLSADEAEAQTRRAEQQTEAAIASATEADLATIISRSAALSGENPEVSLLLALEAHRRAPGPESEQAVLNALGSSTLFNRVASLDALSDPAGPCPATYTNSDGTAEFGVVNSQLVARDLRTGTVTEHGPAPAPCVEWLGDERADRRVAVAEDGLRMWLGSYEAPWETELEFDTPTFLVSRSFSPSDRLILKSGREHFWGLTLLDETTGETTRVPIDDGHGVIDAVTSADGSLIALAAFGPQDNGVTVIIDAATGQELSRTNSQVPATALTIDESAGELIAAINDRGIIRTIDLGSGAVVAEVDATTTSNFREGGLGIRSDGLVVVVSQSRIELVDRRTGPVERPIDVRDVVAGRIQPDGRAVTFTSDGRVVIVDFEQNALVERAWPVELFAEIIINDGIAAVIREPAGDPEVIDLATGARSILELTTADGDRLLPIVALPDDDGIWTVEGGSEFLKRWEGEQLVAQVQIGRAVGGHPQAGMWAIVIGATQGYEQVTLVSLNGDTARVILTVPAPFVSAVHPSRDGGVHILSTDGTLATFDSSGVKTGEILTEATNTRQMTLDRATGKLALGTETGGAMIVDPATGDIEVLPGIESVQALGFARDGELLTIVTGDGTVRLWDVERGASAGLVWDGSGASYSATPWYDEATESVWVATSGQLLQIPVNPQRWIKKACEIVGGGFTQDEWDRFVPGDEPLQSACT